MFDQVENDVDIHFNIIIFLEVFDESTSVSHASSFDNSNNSISKEGHSKEKVEKSNSVNFIGINEL